MCDNEIEALLLDLAESQLESRFVYNQPRAYGVMPKL